MSDIAAQNSGLTKEQKATTLESHLGSMGNVLVAFSGGVDSSVVLKAATMALGDRALGILAETESNTHEDVDLCRRLADEHGLHLETIEYSELAIENYAENPANRCFFCKNELYTRLTAIAKERDVPFVCDGSNADDMGDYRPGLKAVEAHRVRSPLRELGLRKSDVRELAEHYGLPNHDRPSSPCLSSRIPYGMKITREKLDQVAAGERILRRLGFREFRCRHHENVARLEVTEDQIDLALAHRKEIVSEFRKIGFQFVTLDLDGFKSGSLNRVLKDQEIRQA